MKSIGVITMGSTHIYIYMFMAAQVSKSLSLIGTTYEKPTVEKVSLGLGRKHFNLVIKIKETSKLNLF